MEDWVWNVIMNSITFIKVQYTNGNRKNRQPTFHMLRVDPYSSLKIWEFYEGIIRR